MAILDQFQFQIPSDTAQLDQVLQHCEAFQLRHHLASQDWLQCKIVIAEGFTNAVRHAHGEDLKQYQITVELCLSHHSLEIRIWDHSPTVFDLEQYYATQQHQQTTLEDAGGRGMMILQKVANHLTYRRDPQRQQNYLHIVKHLMPRLSSHFITVDQLGDRLADPNLVIVDCRFRLNDPTWGETQYQQGHIPGAYYLHLDRDLSGPVQQHGGRHPLPDPEAFVSLLSRLGIERNRTEVIIYDDFYCAFGARFWWLLKYYGHDKARLLDGGFPAWQTAQAPIDTDIPGFKPGQFEPNPQPQLVVNRQDLLIATDNQRLVIDARDGDRYLGKVEPIDPIAGHIPGALNVPWKQVTDAQGFAQPPEVQQTLWENLSPEQEIVLYCGSGVTACVNWLSLELTGHHNLKLYPGGWSDWCSYVAPSFDTKSP
ncbi:rhodanese-like domain-containing protein [Synechococcus sp. BDU 130192]|uniref:rhodanese-like domain-containing protein n=1 Tax=Synechococcus sp. BDU 130192 TaxID=2042059 RepID=UPI000C068653|nr:rhodanese-like domain-containing protein [Synechococcus sp. BDU 130192]